MCVESLESKTLLEMRANGTRRYLCRGNKRSNTLLDAGTESRPQGYRWGSQQDSVAGKINTNRK